jgi:hypothetical protein
MREGHEVAIMKKACQKRKKRSRPTVIIHQYPVSKKFLMREIEIDCSAAAGLTAVYDQSNRGIHL